MKFRIYSAYFLYYSVFISNFTQLYFNKLLKLITKIVSAFFVCIMFVNIAKPSLVYAIYEYDLPLFISMFCENKDRPQIKCNGKCYLYKLQKEQDKKEATNTLKQLQTEIVYFNLITPFKLINNQLLFLKKAKQVIYYNKLYAFMFISHLKKPPKNLSYFTV